MKITLPVVLAITILLALSCTQHPKPANSTANTPAETPAKAVAYACPMKCEGEKTYPAPGQCPVCGMDLVAVNGSSVAPDSMHRDQPGHEGHNH